MENTHCFDFERLDRFDMRTDVVGNGFEARKNLLSLINHSLVLQHGAVVLEVEGSRL